VARTGQASGGILTSSLRSLAILDLLADAGALGTNEIARRLGATPSTVSRHLGTLVAARLVEYDESGRYRLGVHLVHLGNAVLARLDVRRSAHPHLEALVAELGETVTLSVPSEPDAITIDVVAAPHAVQGVSHLGRPSVAHATAAGKVMLAFTSRRPAPPLARYGARTITDPDELDRELERVRTRGWADAYEEREPGLNAIAAPVRASRGELAAVVAVQGPIPRFGRAAARAALPTLLEHAAEISRELGW
jgi:DNA-binding IclR family transcriptional regulator